MNKRGISPVVGAVFMILIVIAAVGLLWAAISFFITSSAEESTEGLTLVQMSLIENSVIYLPEDALQMSIKRDGNPGEVSGVRVRLESEEGNSEIYDVDLDIKELETTSFNISLNGEIGNITKISVAPRVKDKTGEITDEYVIDKSIVSTQGLVGYWPLNGDFKDASGNGYEGECSTNGCPNPVRGVFQSAYDTEAGQIVATGTENINFDHFTITAWVYKDSSVTNWQRIAGKYLWQPTGGMGFAMDIANASQDQFRCYSDGFFSFWAPKDSFPKEEWMFVVCTFDQNTVKMYANGKLVTTNSASGNLIQTNYPFAIGTTTNGAISQSRLNGNIDEVRLYNRSLTAEEINYLYRYN